MFDPQGAVTEPGVPSLARRLHPKAGPVIVRAADGTRLHTEVFGHEDIRPQGYQCSRDVSASAA